MPVIFEGVTYSYDVHSQRPPALDKVDLTINDGEFVALIGHTGSGKSTLAAHINALKLPTSGRVLVDGLDTAGKKLRRGIRQMVGYVMQYPEYQLFAETVAEDVAFGPRNMNLDAAEVDRRVRSSLEQVGLDYESVAQMSPFDLSGGQQRRVALAGILAMEPRVLTVDEPMAGLDPQGRAEILDIIQALHARGTTIIMVSHSMDDVAGIAQRIIVLDHGRVVGQGTPEEVFAHEEALRAAGLDVPRALHVAHELEERGFVLPRPLPLTLEDLAQAVAQTLAGRTVGAAASAAASTDSAQPAAEVRP